MSTAARRRIDDLRGEIRRHDHLYYVVASPEITDLQYDSLMEQLQELEAQFPDYVSLDSPTQRIGDRPVGQLVQAEHRVPMLSIDNTYSVDDLLKYGERVVGLLEGEEPEWVVELKVDGVAVSLVYENGELARALTRGTGRVGDDITHNARTIADVPLRLIGTQLPPVLEVRGEVYMRNSDLVRLNQQQSDRREAPFANTRNVTAGSIRLLDPRLCAERPLHLFCHGVGYSKGSQSGDYIQFLDELRAYGLPITPLVRVCSTMEDAVQYSETVIEELHGLDFEVDGLVVKINSFAQREKLGATSKSPRWLIAYKFEKYEGLTRVNEIRVQVGKTGTVTPVAELEPIELAGTTVSRASLHNADEIERKDIRVGDVVVVEKAGKIIPHVVRVEKHDRKGNLQRFNYPTECPECGTLLKKDEGGVYIRCLNPHCPAQIKERIRYFASRNAMDIEGLGDKIVEQLVRSGKVADYADLYELSAVDLAVLERMAERSSQKLVESIDRSKGRGLAHLLNALSVRHVGSRVASILAEHFGSLRLLQAASVESISQIHEIGDVIAQSVVDFLQSEFGKRTLDRLEAVGVETESMARGVANPMLSGKTFVVTGKLIRFTRDEIQQLIDEHGGHAASSVSRNTDFVVAGENAGSKLEKAQQLGVAVITEDDFHRLIQGKQ